MENYPEFYIRCGLSDQILTMSRQWNKYASDSGLKVNYYELLAVMILLSGINAYMRQLI